MPESFFRRMRSKLQTMLCAHQLHCTGPVNTPEGGTAYYVFCSTCDLSTYAPSATHRFSDRAPR